MGNFQLKNVAHLFQNHSWKFIHALNLSPYNLTYTGRYEEMIDHRTELYISKLKPEKIQA